MEERTMVQKILKSITLLVALMFIFQFTAVNSTTIPFKVIKIEKVSRYNEDRIAYQHIEKDISTRFDNSISCLLIVKDRKMYLFRDGHDEPSNVSTQRLILEMENRLIPDLWKNKIDNKPDYIRITDRRVEVLKKVNQEFVTNNFGDFFTNVRDKFIKRHVNIFKTLMINRRLSGLFVRRRPLPKKVYDTGPTKYYTSVTGKTIDETIYFAEDADGDNITETFTVNIPDGFHWGFKSGANIIFIYNNSQENIKNLIGKLAYDAYYGTPEEGEIIKKQFPKEDEIKEMIDDIYRVVDPNFKKIEENSKK